MKSVTTDGASLNPYAPEWLNNDPYPLCTTLREIGPAVWIDDKFWVVTTAEAVHAALRDHERLGSRNPAYEKRAKGPALQAASEFLVNMDDPEHRQQRQLLSSAYTPARVKHMESLLSDIIDERLDALEAQAPCDFAEVVSFPLPLMVFAGLFGIPEEDQTKISHWARTYVNAITRATTREKMEAADNVMAEFFAYVERLAEERSANPGDDHLSMLLAAEHEDGLLDRRQLIVSTVGLLVAGYDSTAHAFGNALVAFNENPDQWQRLCEQPDLAASAFEEVLRYEAPTLTTTRTVREDFDFFGSAFKQGQSVTILIASANRDPEAFAEPEQFDITRSRSTHMAFGGGRHFCLGAGLSRLESPILLRKLAERFPNLRLAGSPTPCRTGLVRGYTSMPVEI